VIPKLLTTKEAAVALGVSETTLDRWRWTGLGPLFVKLPKKIMYTEAAINDYINARTKQPMEP
jgi:predicted site-specific integrase-resolvase